MKLWRKVRAGLELIEAVEEIREDWINGGRDELFAAFPATDVGTGPARRVLKGVDYAVELVRRLREKP